MRKVITILLTILMPLCAAAEKDYVVVTGETALGGVSFYREMVIDKGGTLPEREDLNLLAEVMFHENWSTDKNHEAARLTGAVVLNRVKSKRWPNTIREVLYQKRQYSTTGKFFSKEIPQECYDIARDLLVNGTPDVPENVIFQSTHPEFGSGVWKCINGEYFNYE